MIWKGGRGGAGFGAGVWRGFGARLRRVGGIVAERSWGFGSGCGLFGFGGRGGGFRTTGREVCRTIGRRGGCRTTGREACRTGQFFQGPAKVALAGADDALEVDELGVVTVKDFARGGGGGLVRATGHGAIVGQDLVAFEFTDAGFDEAHAAETPFGVDDDVDEATLGGTGGLVAFVVLGGEVG